MTDDDDTVDKLQQAIIRKLTPWLVVGGMALGGVGGSGILRVDKFGESDFDAAMIDHTQHMEQHIAREILHATILIEAKMPPAETKKRIRALERYVEKNDPAYQVPTQEWN